MNMTPTFPAAEELSPVKRALLEIRELRARVAELESAAAAPIAIVGTGMRLPAGIRSLEALWSLLQGGGDAIGPTPAERWDLDALFDADPDTPGKMFTREGGFIDAPYDFDAEFFGIAPLEAETMDPQQRLLLECAWHAFEDAGIAPGSLHGSPTGVFLGISNSDYGRMLFSHPQRIDPYFCVGTAFSVAAGRIAYVLGLQGPAMCVDTACSSSLVALHLAAQSLRRGECSLALAGGINLMLSPEININFSKARMMAPDGRCKAFDAAADGYVRGEGCGVVVLKRLADCTTADRVLAVLRGSALNQDGRSSGLTAPNGPAQEAVLRAALQQAGLQSTQVGYVEAHGTGTSLGDPIELQALGAVMGGADRAGAPLAVGSIKTNLGHLEAAAGIAGVFKAIAMLRHGQIPPHLHLRQPTPHFDWAASRMQVPTNLTPWPASGEPRRAGVSSFGFSGTNAHVVLEEAPAPAAASPAGMPSATTNRPWEVLTLSARDPRALAELAAVAADAVQAAPARWVEFAHTANCARTPLAHRASVRARDAASLADGLRALARGESADRAMRGQRKGAPRVAFLYTGGGAQTVGMARALYDAAPIFRRTFDAAAAFLEPLLGIGLREVIDAPGGDRSPLHETRHGQPAQVAVALALTDLWASWGVRPAAVLGHSLGEYAAAYAAGLLSLPDALRMVVARTRAVDALAAAGRMATIFAAPAAVQAQIVSSASTAVIAAFNGPEQVVVSGTPEEVEALATHFERSGTRVSRLRVAYASHSPMMEPALAPFEASIADIAYGELHTTFVSNRTGAPVTMAQVARAAYWRDHLRQPVRFSESMRALAALGITHYVEIGPHPVLVGIGALCVEGDDVAWLPSLRRDDDDWDVMLESLQQLHAAGLDPDWQGFDAGAGTRKADFPLYPFQRRRYRPEWLDETPAALAARGTAASPATTAPWSVACASLADQSRRGPIGISLDGYGEKWASLRRLTHGVAAAALREAGLFADAGASADLDDVRSRLGAGVPYGHLLRRWLEGLCEDGLLRQADGRFVADAPLPAPDLAALWADAEQRLPDNRPLLDYLRHCAALARPVLAGRTSPLETLFPGGDFALSDGLYRRSATMRYVNELAAAAVRAFAAAHPAPQLRVLEVGAGTGGTTQALLPVLDPQRTHYRFTDVSSFFFDRAREQFAAYPFIDCEHFDVDRELADQGLQPGSADLVVAANAVHASRDLRATLRRLRELLAPGGMLLLVESTQHLAWFDISTGLIEGWQHFADDLRTDNPLLPPERWVGALRDAGFDAAAAYPEAGTPAAELAQHVVVAHVAGDVTSHAAATGRPLAGAARTGAGASSASPEPAPTASAPAPSVLQQLAEALPDERLPLLRDFVRERVMRVLKLPPDAPPGLRDRLMDIGFDSLMAVQLRNQLGKALELKQPLPATLMFDQPTIEELARYLLQRLAPPAATANGTAMAPAATEAASLVAPRSGSATDVSAMSDDEVAALLEQRLGT
ncbi:MAG: acyltransferase domain-containing protein [Rubrivivax sp.]|nr:acyltransferase domain-containing protein [Rubrivivax sp.]